MKDRREFVVSAEEAGVRLDVYLARKMPEWSRSQLQRLIRAGKVKVGERMARKPGGEAQAGSRITVEADRPQLRAVPEPLPLEIVHEDDDILVINKPAGMVVHAGSGVRSGTMVNALLHHLGPQGLSTAGGELRPGIVHRLDRSTSGVVVVAKNDVAHRALAAQFKAREVLKTYWALVHGRLRAERGEIARPIGRDPARRVRMKAGGLKPREAATDYRVLRRFEHYTLVEAHPRTGRTHQLRVHFAAIGHPIVGDTLYGAPSRLKVGSQLKPTLERNFLHAAGIEFRHPRTGEVLRFKALWPEELRSFLAALESAGLAPGGNAFV